MLGAATFDLIRNADVLTQDNMLNIGVGFVAAFISALLVVSALVKFVERHTLRVFAWSALFGCNFTFRILININQPLFLIRKEAFLLIFGSYFFYIH
jgi:undecaprenyl pyrophosphate phosphatase UppP